MNAPEIISSLVRAQDNFDSKAYADCFTETAVVFDEGKTHTGRIEIAQWIAEANKTYKAVMKPLRYDEKENILEAEVSGTFPGSPAVLKYHFEFNEGFIKTLKITG